MDDEPDPPATLKCLNKPIYEKRCAAMNSTTGPWAEYLSVFKRFIFHKNNLIIYCLETFF